MKFKKSILVLLVAASISISCMWDYDTIEMERKEFPTAVELIAGKFLRHSSEFYYWRAQHRELAIEQFPDSLSLYDDAGVAWSKLGNDKRAIELMLQKEKKHPGLYETAANLGTFYIHDGQFETGLEYIKKAIEINPDAHFRREVYQQYLVEYLLSKMQDGNIKLPLNNKITRYYPSQMPTSNFYSFVIKKTRTSDDDRLKERDKAITGILGMMRFGNYNSPVLLEALGDLLMGYGRNEAHRNLAGRAYLKASLEVKDSTAKESYRRLAINAMYSGYFKEERSGRLTLDIMETQLKKERAEADAFFGQIKKDEWKWIKSGVNVDEAFSKKYFENPKFDKIKYEGHGKTRDSDKEYNRKVNRGRGGVRRSEPIDIRFKELELPLDSTMRAFIDNSLNTEQLDSVNLIGANPNDKWQGTGIQELEEKKKKSELKKPSSSNNTMLAILLSLGLGGIVIFLGMRSRK